MPNPALLIRLFSLFAAALATGGHAMAQGSDEERPRGWLRFLPVGDAPPFRQVITEDGIRQELAAEPGTIPPRNVEVVILEKRTEMQLVLGRMTKPMVAVAGPVAVAEQGAGKPWQQVVMPAAPAALAVLFRDPKAKDWDDARHLVIPDDVQSFQAGQVRFINVSPRAVAVNFKKQMIGLGPGKAVTRGQGGGVPMQNAPLAVAIRDERGDWKPIFNNVVNLNAGERGNVVIYRADGIRPRRPVKVFILREKALLPKLPKK